MTYEDTYNTLKYADRAKHIEAQVPTYSYCKIVTFHVTLF